MTTDDHDHDHNDDHNDDHDDDDNDVDHDHDDDDDDDDIHVRTRTQLFQLELHEEHVEEHVEGPAADEPSQPSLPTDEPVAEPLSLAAGDGPVDPGDRQEFVGSMQSMDQSQRSDGSTVPQHLSGTLGSAAEGALAETTGADADSASLASDELVHGVNTRTTVRNVTKKAKEVVFMDVDDDGRCGSMPIGMCLALYLR